MTTTTHDTVRLLELERGRQSLERRLSHTMGAVVHVSITDNARRVITVRPGTGGVVRVRLHHMFALHTPKRVLRALVEWLGRDDDDDDDDHPRSAGIVDDYVKAQGHRLRARHPIRACRVQGRTHDLDSILAELRARFFPGGECAAVHITWGRRTQGPRRKIVLGSYSVAERLIRIHPALDRSWVPKNFLACTVYHELLHHVVPPSPDGQWHTPEFRARERAFPGFDSALAWERANIARLLRA